MVALTGWIAIVGRRTERLDRACALVYGLGLGLIGDEVGLLLTFRNYYSELTYQIFVGAIGLIILGALAVRFGERLRKDLIGMRRWEVVELVGLFLAGFSTLFFAFDQEVIGIAFAVTGILAVILGFRYRHEMIRVQAAN
jgi:DMSO/TMAO reductase YedYZ heme-binding membrane subunit